MLVAVNDFVRRQVKNSGKTYAKTLSFDQIATMHLLKCKIKYIEMAIVMVSVL